MLCAADLTLTTEVGVSKEHFSNMSAKFKTEFNNELLTDSAFASWLQAVPADPQRARCTLCCKTFDLSNMGRQAIVSHKAGVKHQRNSSTATKQHQLTFTKLGIVPQNEDASSEQTTVSVEPSVPPNVSSSTNV